MDFKLLIAVVLLVIYGCSTEGKLIVKPENMEVKVNHSTYFNCSTTNLGSTATFWFQGTRRIFTSSAILESSHERFEIKLINRNVWNGTYIYNLVIHSVQPVVAGKYICVDNEGSGEKYQIQLTVLASRPKRNIVTAISVVVAAGTTLAVIAALICVYLRWIAREEDTTGAFGLDDTKLSEKHELLEILHPDGLPEKSKSSPDLIRTRAAEVTGNSINGLTILDEELFVVSANSSEVEVYDSIKLSLSRRFYLRELIHPRDIGSCNKNKCLYVFDYKSIEQSNEILRVDPCGKLIKKWSTGGDYGFGLSVTYESSIILAVCTHGKLNEYSPDGELIRQIYLRPEEAGIRFPLVAIKLINGHFLVSHGLHGNDLHRVCIVDEAGKLQKSFGGDSGSTIERLNRPVDLAVNGNGSVLVVDRDNGRVLLLDSDLKFKREVLWKEKHELRYPRRILLDETNGRMFVADNKWISDGRILIFHPCLQDERSNI